MDSSEPLSLAGKVAVVTGAGSGLGRAEALALAGAGADVVVNDVSEAAHSVVDEIKSLGVRSSAVLGDVSAGDTAETLIAAATDLGGPHVVVNNAGVLRDRMLFKMSDQEWDDVIRVHLRGHFRVSRAATVHWRQQAKESGAPVYARLVNTASEAFLFGAEGQPNYAAAKAGITSLTVSTARAMARYGVRANVICPRARTAMTEHVFGAAPGEGVDPLSTEHVTPLVGYLAAPGAEDINGQVFVVHGGMVALLAAPTVEQRFDSDGPEWTMEGIARKVGGYFADREERMFASTELMSLP